MNTAYSHRSKRRRDLTHHHHHHHCSEIHLKMIGTVSIMHRHNVIGRHSKINNETII